ncbi:MAG: hypothetical protein KKB62_03685 [Nanoarchaeota archaeon]|nr:hypothetical protein [Nanoarchaeota archaeon]
MSYKKGLSQVVSTVLLILLSVAFVGGIFYTVRTYVETGIESSDSCSNIIEKVNINSEYTCYDSSSNSVVVSIARSEISMDSLLVSIYSDEDGNSKIFFLSNEQEEIEGVSNYDSGGAEVSMVSLPGNESGKTYCVSGFPSAPTRIEVAPKIGGVQCSVVDTVGEIKGCVNLGC